MCGLDHSDHRIRRGNENMFFMYASLLTTRPVLMHFHTTIKQHSVQDGYTQGTCKMVGGYKWLVSPPSPYWCGALVDRAITTQGLRFRLILTQHKHTINSRTPELDNSRVGHPAGFGPVPCTSSLHTSVGSTWIFIPVFYVNTGDSRLGFKHFSSARL
jgi:hypothetical protein